MALRVSRQAVDVLGQKDSDLRIVTQAIDVLAATDPDIRVNRIAVEYLFQVVATEVSATSTLALTQLAENAIYLYATSTLVLSQATTTNIKAVSASSTLVLTQDESVVYVEVPKTNVTLALTQDASYVLNPGEDAENTLALTQAASYDRVRARSAESTLSLGDLTTYVGPKWVNAFTVIALTQDVYIPVVYEVAASSQLALTQAAPVAGTKRFTVESIIDLAQVADTIVKIRDASSPIALTQAATADKILTAHSQIVLTQEIKRGAIDKSAESQLDLDQVARHQPLPQFAESQIELSQDNWQSIKYVFASSQIDLTQSEHTSKPIRANATSEMSETDWVVDLITGEVTEEEVGLRQSVELVHFGTQSSESILSFNQVVGLTHVRANGTSVSASTAISVTQEARLSTTGVAASVINILQTAEGWAGRPCDSQLDLTQEATYTFSKPFTSQSDLEINQAVAYTLIIASTTCQYSPFVGGSSDPDAPTPPSTSLQGPMAGIQVPFQLVYPSVGAVTDSVSLKTPNLGNVDRLSFNRVQRETRGGTLVVYADPMWPKIQTLVLSFSGLKRVEALNLLTFIEDHLGQEIGLIDWEHRFWRGVITTPDQPIVEDAFDSYTASFDFQGELDPAWNPQVVPPSLRYSAIRSEQEGGYYVPNEPQLPSVPEADYLSAEADSLVKIGYPIYLKSNGHLDPAQADAQATAGVVGMSIADVSASAICKYLTEGKVTRTDWTEVAGTTLLTPGARYYLSPTTAGRITLTAPSTTGQLVVTLGHATSTTEFDIEIGAPVLL